MIEHGYAVIMAGGGGTRLWPLSRQDRPKQTIQLFGEQTLFQLSCDRLKGYLPPEHIFIITGNQHASLLRGQYPDISGEQYLLEPFPRGTAAVVGLGAVALQHRDPDAIMCVLTSDHFIAPVEQFQTYLTAAMKVADEGYLVTLGIHPTYPATGYGYIQRGELIGKFEGLQAYKTIQFREKPDLESARRMLSEGDYTWNSGMFFWRADRILDEFAKWMPELCECLMKIRAAWGTDQQQVVMDQVWKTIQPQTIDYGIMEKADNVYVICTDMGWSDLGTWSSLHEHSKIDSRGNSIVRGEVFTYDTRGNIFNVSDGKVAVIQGLQDFIVVDSDDVLLIVRKDEEQNIKNYLEDVRKASGDKFQ
mgnify:CR=1 FL=1